MPETFDERFCWHCETPIGARGAVWLCADLDGRGEHPDGERFLMCAPCADAPWPMSECSEECFAAHPNAKILTGGEQ